MLPLATPLSHNALLPSGERGVVPGGPSAGPSLFPSHVLPLHLRHRRHLPHGPLQSGARPAVPRRPPPLPAFARLSPPITPGPRSQLCGPCCLRSCTLCWDLACVSQKHLGKYPYIPGKRERNKETGVLEWLVMGVVIHDFGPVSCGNGWLLLAPVELPTFLSLQHSIADSQSL